MTPRVIVGAPVAERAWVLPRWFECLSKQTLQPSGFCFIYSDSQDDTHAQLTNHIAPSDIRRVKLPFISRDRRNHDQSDPWSAKHMSVLRNELRRLFLTTEGDYLVSLDTDILLEDEHILEELIKTVQPGPVGQRYSTPSDYDVACARTCLHPLGEQSQCYNAGIFGGGEGFDQVWQRMDVNALVYKPPVRIDIPMAIWAAPRHVVGMCAYKEHAQGEDVGFAQSLQAHKFRVGWRHDLVARHIWGPSYLAETRDATHV